MIFAGPGLGLGHPARPYVTTGLGTGILIAPPVVEEKKGFVLHTGEERFEQVEAVTVLERPVEVLPEEEALRRAVDAVFEDPLYAADEATCLEKPKPTPLDEVKSCGPDQVGGSPLDVVEEEPLDEL